MDILCIGQLAADVLLKPVERLDYSIDTTRIDRAVLNCGGDSLNTALTLKKLGNDVALVSMVGQDVFGDFILDSLTEAGIDTRGILRHETAATTFCAVMVNAANERAFFYLGGSCDELTFDDIPKNLLEQPRVVHCGGFYQLRGLDGESVAKLMALAREKGKITSMDVTWDSSGEWRSIRPVLPYVDYFMPSYNEAKHIAGETQPEKITARLRELGAGNVILKMGRDGGYADTETGRFFFPAYDVPVKDTTGAGDSFAAGVLTGISRGWEMEKSVRLASAVSAHCIRQLGATAGIPDYDAIEKFMQSWPWEIQR